MFNVFMDFPNDPIEHFGQTEVRQDSPLLEHGLVYLGTDVFQECFQMVEVNKVPVHNHGN